MAIEDYYSEVTLRKITETTDARGGAIQADADTTFQGLVTQSSSRDLEIANKMQIETTHTLYCAVSVDIDVEDKIVDGSKIYQVVSEPLDTVKRGHHFRVLLRRLIKDGGK